MDDDLAVRTLVAFVARLRRISLHPLALQDDREFLNKLYTVEMKTEVRSDGTAMLRSPLPDEVQFESLATRVRPFTIKSDPTYYVRTLEALNQLTDLNDPQIANNAKRLRKDWDVTDRTSRTRAYLISTEAGAYTDIELAFAWLYQDAVKSDASTTGEIGIVERYRAAVGVFSHIAVIALRTLDYIKLLSELGKLELPDGTFTDPVTVTNTEIVMDGQLFAGPVGTEVNLPDVLSSGQIPEGFRTAFDSVHEEVQRRKQSEGS
jgi:hypothetical protein